MKKVILLFIFIFQANMVLAQENYNRKSFIRNCALYLIVKVNALASAIANNSIVQKLFRYIDVSDHSLSSDELVIIIPKDENNFEIKLLNLYKINQLKDKFEIPASIEITKEIYEKIKKITVTLECLLKKDVWLIRLPNQEAFNIKIQSDKMEAVILSNENLKYMTEDLYDMPSI